MPAGENAQPIKMPEITGNLINFPVTEPASTWARAASRGYLPWLATTAFIVIAVARIVSTYPVFNQTFDEGLHIASGMEWWQRGTYNYERKHTPLARIAEAAPLYLRGLRGQNLPNYVDEGNLILSERNEYFTNLAWGRAGNLPFFILSNVLLFLWARRWWGSWTGVAAVGLFSALPPILGHAAVATTDMAAVSGIIAAGYAFCLWIERPDLKRAVVFGLSLAFAMLGKPSVLPFFAIGAALTLAWVGWRRLPVGFFSPIPVSKQLRNLALSAVVAAVVIWAPYHFRFAVLIRGDGYRPPIASVGRLGPMVDRLHDTKIPLGEFLGAFGSAYAFNKSGAPVFFRGEFRDKGWWYFFPVVLAIKTPIAFLLLLFAGIPVAWTRLQGAEWQRGVPLLFATGVLASCIMSNLNLGVRHILPIYPLLTLVAAPALVWLVGNVHRNRLAGIAAVVVIGAYCVESALPHPDYLAAFNPLAGSQPEKIVVDSNLDWGQDLQRLSIRLKELKVPSLSLLYFGSSDVRRFGLPLFTEVGPKDNPTGWVAVSMTRMMLDCARDGYYCSWKDRKPVERVGRSIYLFYVPPEGT